MYYRIFNHRNVHDRRGNEVDRQDGQRAFWRAAPSFFNRAGLAEDRAGKGSLWTLASLPRPEGRPSPLSELGQALGWGWHRFQGLQGSGCCAALHSQWFSALHRELEHAHWTASFLLKAWKGFVHPMLWGIFQLLQKLRGQQPHTHMHTWRAPLLSVLCTEALHRTLSEQGSRF